MVPVAFSLLILSAFLDGVGTGWTVYPPLSARLFSGGFGVDLGILSLHVAGASSILASINFITTSLLRRNKSIGVEQVSLFV